MTRNAVGENFYLGIVILRFLSELANSSTTASMSHVGACARYVNYTMQNAWVLVQFTRA